MYKGCISIFGGKRKLQAFDRALDSKNPVGKRFRFFIETLSNPLFLLDIITQVKQLYAV